MSRLRTRLPQLLSLWAGAVLAEGALYYFFLRWPFMRGFVAPFAMAVLMTAVVATWRLSRPRQGADRRVHERRAHQRRAEAEPPGLP